MSIRAAIFDIYGTLLEIGPPPPNPEALWTRLFEDALGSSPACSRTEFDLRTTQIVSREHAAAKDRGIFWPEIRWPAVVLEAVPVLAQLDAARFEDFLLRQMQMGRTLRLADGAAECLCELSNTGRLLGIASNSQAYTGRELTAAFQGTGLSLSLFERDLQFWSFENGFSKPNPHVFRILTARLEERGIRPAETVMIGDRLDNDIVPARAFGWQTWQLASAGFNHSSGNWHELRAWLRAGCGS